MNQWINDSVDQWFSDPVANQWTKEPMNFATSSSKSAPIPPVFQEPWHANKSNSHCSLVHILPTSSSKKVPRSPQFLTALKCSERDRNLTFWSTNRALAHNPVFCPQLSQIEARTRGNRDLTSATPGATLPKKTQGFAPKSVFHPWIHALPNCHSPLLLPHANCSWSLCCWHDDHMMTWWWSLDAEKSAPGHSSVTQKFSN